LDISVSVCSITYSLEIKKKIIIRKQKHKGKETAIIKNS